MAGVPGGPDVDRGGAGDAGGGFDPGARVDVREPPDLRGQADPDGCGHRDVRSAPRDRHGPAAAAGRARGVAGHPRGDGDAAGGAVCGGAQRNREHPPDRPRVRADRRAPARAGGEHRARRGRVPTAALRGRHPLSGCGHDPPDPQRYARRAARRDARDARDHGGAARRVRAQRLRRGVHACARVRGGAGARGDDLAGGPAPGVPGLRRDGRGAGAALGHDGADRADGGDALRDGGGPAAVLLPGALLPRGAPAARAAARAAAGRHRAGRGAGAAGHGRGAGRAVRGARRDGPRGLPRGSRRRVAVRRADGGPRRRARDAPGAAGGAGAAGLRGARRRAGAGGAARRTTRSCC